MLRFLIKERRLNPQFVNSYHHTILSDVCHWQRNRSFRFLIDECKMDPTKKEGYGDNLLASALVPFEEQYPNAFIVDILIDKYKLKPAGKDYLSASEPLVVYLIQRNALTLKEVKRAVNSLPDDDWRYSNRHYFQYSLERHLQNPMSRVWHEENLPIRTTLPMKKT